MSEKPHITGTKHVLPFDKLSAEDFERLCLWLVTREGYENAEHLGAAGGKDHGRDIEASLNNKRWAFQCKRRKNFRPSDAIKELNKILALPLSRHPGDLPRRPDGIIFVVTCRVTDATRQSAIDHCAGALECGFWARTELDEKVKRHDGLVDEFFQRPPPPPIPPPPPPTGNTLGRLLREDAEHPTTSCVVQLAVEELPPHVNFRLFEGFDHHHQALVLDWLGTANYEMMVATEERKEPDDFPVESERDKKDWAARDGFAFLLAAIVGAMEHSPLVQERAEPYVFGVLKRYTDITLGPATPTPAEKKELYAAAKNSVRSNSLDAVHDCLRRMWPFSKD